MATAILPLRILSKICNNWLNTSSSLQILVCTVQTWKGHWASPCQLFFQPTILDTFNVLYGQVHAAPGAVVQWLSGGVHLI